MADETQTAEAKAAAALRAEAIKAWHDVKAKDADELKQARAELVEKFPVLREIFSGANHS